MNRRSLFRMIPVAPVVGASAIMSSVKPKLDVKLPQVGEMNWGQTINKAIRDIQEEINKRG
jgi:hypothetical protein